jgi:hypothetical protein
MRKRLKQTRANRDVWQLVKAIGIKPQDLLDLLEPRMPNPAPLIGGEPTKRD